jgi:hypothetical protein
MPRFLRPLVLLGFLILLLSPYLITGWYQDDSLNASTRGILATRGYGVLDLWWSQQSEWMSKHGRFFPFAILLQDLQFTYLSLTAARIHQVGMVILNLLLLGQVVRELGEGRPGWDPRLTWLPMIFAVPLFQLVEGHDSVASYNALMQWVFLWGGLHLWAIARFLRRPDRRGVLWAAAAFCFLALITYEVGAIFPVASFLVLLLAIRWDRVPFRRLRPGLLATAVPTALYLAIILVLRSRMTAAYAGIQPKLGLAVVKTFLFQWSGAIPLAHPVFGRCKVLRPPTGPELLLTLCAGGLAWAVFRLFAARPDSRRDRADSRTLWPIWVVGLCCSFRLRRSSASARAIRSRSIGRVRSTCRST